MSKNCPICGEEFICLGNHWSQSSCGYPEVSDRQKEISVGMLLGDAYINEHSDSGNSMLRTKMINEEFLNWLNEEMGFLSSSLSKYMSAEESFNTAPNRLPNNVTSVDNYSTLYEYRTVRHPYFNELREWYSSGVKRFPNNLNLSPLMAKVWYCCDGSWDNRVCIYAKNESDRVDLLTSMFPIGEPRWQESSNCIRFKRDDSERVLNWMGEPLPGFEYKWGV